MLALAIFAAAAALWVRQIGLVGEVAIGWGLGRPPAVLLSVDPPIWADGSVTPSGGSAWGPLVASQVRPIEALRLGPLWLPLAVNSYTGGPADWPARLLFALTGSLAAVGALHVALGGGLIALAHRFVRAWGGEIAAGITALLLATDAGFLFYRKALGGTELLLQLAGMMCLWGLWSRRWAGGRWALLIFAAGVGLGVLAKITFVITLGALLGAALLTRWDKPALRPPLPRRWWAGGVVVLLLTAPLWIAAIHQALGVPAEPHVLSHDFPGLQLDRVAGFLSAQDTPARERWSNLSYWAGNPYAFLAPAYGANPVPAWGPLRVLAWGALAAGVALAWRRRVASKGEALIRFLSVYLALQVALLLVVARDLHHLAQATPTLALLGGLAIERLAATSTPARSIPRARDALLLALPWLVTGLYASARADAALASIPAPSFTAGGQEDLVGLLVKADARRVVTCDYELYGALDLLAPGVRFEHAWAAASRSWQQDDGRDTLLSALLRRAEGAHLLIVKPTVPMIYNLSPGPARVLRTAEKEGLHARIVGKLPDEAAVLYVIEP